MKDCVLHSCSEKRLRMSNENMEVMMAMAQLRREHKAHKNGIRISRVCAWNTSKLAFDGSGVVLRGKDADLRTYELCKFPNGKIYNCDLSASYNIGARYFIREAQKSMSAKMWSDIVVKVPECQKRTRCTYATLLKINKVAW